MKSQPDWWDVCYNKKLWCGVKNLLCYKNGFSISFVEKKRYDSDIVIISIYSTVRHVLAMKEEVL